MREYKQSSFIGGVLVILIVTSIFFFGFNGNGVTGMAVSSGMGMVSGMVTVTPSDKARDLQYAMYDGFFGGTHEDTIFDILENVDSEWEMDEIEKEYRSLTGNSLESDLRWELSQYDQHRALSALYINGKSNEEMVEARDKALKLSYAVYNDILETDEEGIYLTLESVSSSSEMTLIEEIYKEMTDYYLWQDIRAEMSGYEQKRALSLVNEAENRNEEIPMKSP